jgi:hypothetical protein
MRRRDDSASRRRHRRNLNKEYAGFLSRDSQCGLGQLMTLTDECCAVAVWFTSPPVSIPITNIAKETETSFRMEQAPFQMKRLLERDEKNAFPPLWFSPARGWDALTALHTAHPTVTLCTMPANARSERPRRADASQRSARLGRRQTLVPPAVA